MKAAPQPPEGRAAARRAGSRRRARLEYLFLPRFSTRDIGELVKACFCAAVRVLWWTPGDPWSPPPDCSLGNATVYGGPRNTRLVARRLGGRPLEPSPRFLPALPEPYRRRRVELTTLAAARALRGPAFCKPAIDKEFPAGVYAAGEALPAGSLPANLPVLIAEVVRWEVEFRTFVLDRRVRADSAYGPAGESSAGAGDRREALAFCQQLLTDRRVQLPRAVALDVGRIAGRGWAVVEANAAVASGLFGCEPRSVLEVLRHGLTAA